jgi:hypothetical protein
MRKKHNQKKLSATKKNPSRKHQAGKHRALYSSIASGGKDKKRKRVRILNRSRPTAAETTAYSEDALIFQAPEAQVSNQINETSEIDPTLEQTLDAVERQVTVYVEEMTRLEAALLEEKVARTIAEENAKKYALLLSQLEEHLKTQRESEEITGVCDCCGKADISVNHLVGIDSGQRLCPACFGELTAC